MKESLPRPGFEFEVPKPDEIRINQEKELEKKEFIKKLLEIPLINYEEREILKKVLKVLEEPSNYFQVVELDKQEYETLKTFLAKELMEMPYWIKEK